MKKILLVYLPFCTPATPSYSLTAMHSFLQSNCYNGIKLDVLDLNIVFHSLKFPDFQQYFKDKNKWSEYGQKSEEYIRLSGSVYSQNNSAVVNGDKPEFFDQLLSQVISKKPDIVAFSIVYSSQAFFAKSMLDALKDLGIMTVIGGPSMQDALIADHKFSNEVEFLEFINGKKTKKLDHGVPDFSIWDLDKYFTPYPVLPLKITSTCPYQRCAFCAHYAEVPYHEYDLDNLKKTILKSGQKYFFIIDDMIPRKRLLQFVEMIRPLDCFWACQLRPTKEFDYETLNILRESGLVMILWGVESGSDRVLELMEKGTNLKDVKKVLRDSFEAGISNVAYIMFGFPTETIQEFKQTLCFLEENKEYIDLVSSTVFGLQHGTPIFENPEKFGIININEKKRTVLEPKITYDVESGLTQKQATRLKDRNKKKIERIGKFPKSMNFFREHMIVLLGDEKKETSSIKLINHAFDKITKFIT
ncbi:MAG: B12-binding domain-containing radical SAM protein [Candidatus Woesearchaeota archaeon]